MIWQDRLIGSILWFGIGYLFTGAVCSFYESAKHHPRAINEEETYWCRTAANKTAIVGAISFMVMWQITHF